jgi:hypothetical protein
MYHQIKPTEMFRERQLMLLKEAENRRRARRLRARRTLGWIGRTALFCAGLATMLALVIVLATLMVAILLATATPAIVEPGGRDLKKRCAGSGYHVIGSRPCLRLKWSRFVGALQPTYESGRRRQIRNTEKGVKR